MGNKAKYYIYSVLTNLVLTFSTGSIIQSFLKWKNMSLMEISIFTSLISITQTGMIILSIFVVDKIGSIKRTIAWLTLLRSIFFVAMMYICKTDSMKHAYIFNIVMLVCLLNNMSVGMINVLIYKLPYMIIDIQEYSGMLNTTGILVGIVTSLFPAFFVRLSSSFEYENMIFICFGICIVFSIAAGFICGSMKEVNSGSHKNNRKPILLSVLKLPATYLLALPNLMRGIAMGIIGMVSVIMLSTITDDVALSSVLSVILPLSTICACMVYNHFVRRIKVLQFILSGGFIMCIAMCFMLAGGNVIIFCIMYFIACFGMTFVDYSIPVYITEIVSYDAIGSYTAIRMFLTTLGTTLGNYVTGIVLDSHANSYMLLIAGGIMVLAAVLCYYAVSKKMAAL